MAHQLSRRQYEVLTAIARLSEERHYMPSVRELGADLGLSAATTQQHINALRQKGFLDSDGSAHGLRLLKPLEGENIREENPAGELEVPLLGTIAAGRPIEAVLTAGESVPLSRGMARPGDYLLRVSGESMIEDGILDGDLVLIRPQTTVENGQIAVGLLEDGTATLKRVYREGGRVRLQPANREMVPFYVNHLRVQGKVVGLLRLYDR